MMGSDDRWDRRSLGKLDNGCALGSPANESRANRQNPLKWVERHVQKAFQPPQSILMDFG
ncbi:MAG: hypothetical protein MUF49_26540 [Oculatellaceae cyanobacterium Prado106]|nr:hypothetical protein [Oculatellaceae cyanobacterium Prado106]